MPTSGPGVIFLFSFFISLGAVVSPGPVSAAIISEAPRQGWRVGTWVALGHTSLELGMVLAISIGLAAGLASPAAQRLIALGGSLILAWIGVRYVSGAWRGTYRLPEPEQQATARSSDSLVTLGILTTVSNPFWYAWWVTVAAGYLAQARQAGVIAIAAFYLGHITADFTWDTALAGATQAGARWLNPTSYRALILLTGVFMLYYAVVFMKTGINL